MNPYSLKIPESRGYYVQQIAFSGGRSSAYMLCQIVEANNGLPATCAVTFQNTSRESPATYDFIEQVAEYLNVQIQWLEYEALAVGETEFDPPPTEPAVGDYRALAKDGDYHQAITDWLSKPVQKPTCKIVSPATAKRNGEVFDMLIRKNRMLPNRRFRFCTKEMKVKIAHRYMQSRFPDVKTHASAVGIRFDESRRIYRTRSDIMPKKLVGTPEQTNWSPRWRKGDSKEWHLQGKSAQWFPMHHAKVTKETVNEFWNRMPFDLELPVLHGKTLGGNCQGCFYHSELEHYAYVRGNRADAWKWLCREHWLWKTKQGGFYSFSDNFPMRDVWDDADTDNGQRIMDTAGFGCQAEAGECSI